MSRSCTIRLKLIVRAVLITFQIRYPVTGKMLRNTPVIILRPHKHVVNDPAGTYTVFLILCYVCCCKKSLHSMHICIQTTVRIQLGKFCIPGIAGKSLSLIPETQVIKCQCILQKLLRSRSASKYTGRCCQDYKRMCIALLGWYDLVIFGKTCIPASVFIIMKFPAKTFQCYICKCLASLMSYHGTNAVNVSHTACDPGLTVSVLPWSSIISQIIGASSR